MKRYTLVLALPLALLLSLQSARAQYLWQIGTSDGKYDEFALANEPTRFHQDPLFLVGKSEASKDWPFIHPGPADSWAGARPHTFTIVFSLSKLPTQGDCTLTVALVDTHSSAPPRLTFDINGHPFTKQLPRGGSDQSLNHHPELGKPYHFDIKFPIDVLKQGSNVIDILNDKGSWAAYDSLALKTPPGAQLETKDSFTIATAKGIRGLIERDGKLLQPIDVTIRHVGPAITATVEVANQSATKELRSPSEDVQLLIPAVTSSQKAEVHITAASEKFTTTATLDPVHKVTIYILPHSHNDVGYTDIQTNVEKKQMANLDKGMAIAKKTANYPPGARFVWNMEVLWGVDLYQHRMSAEKQQEFLDAVKDGQVALNGGYANELTGLCRPEELLQLFRYATQLTDQTGVKIDSAMQSDVPGMTWGMSTAMAQAGIRYFSLAPNYFDRIGSLMVTWQDKPFWWESPGGKEKVLVWVPYTGYAMSHLVHSLSDQWINDYQDRMDKVGFPYDIDYIRWSGHGDNAEPDPAICEFIKSWNSKYAWPKLIISSTSQAFRAFEQRYGNDLPTYKGDLTPYWEDGAASSALETAMNRNSADRLVQAETLFALRKLPFPSTHFDDAWRNVLLYSEHTWGAFCSVSDSENPFTTAQWKIKQAFALDADKQSRDLIQQAIAPASGDTNTQAVDVFNTTSWTRTDLVIVPKEMCQGKDRVTDHTGKPVPSQRLSNGDLALLPRDIPGFATERFTFTQGPAFQEGPQAWAEGDMLDNGVLRCRVDKSTGGIAELKLAGSDQNFARQPLNNYVYLPGSDLSNLQSSGPATTTVLEKGPLVASLRIDSDAPGCNHLTRELRLTAGSDHVDLSNTLDKKRVPLNPHPGQGSQSGAFAQRGSKESVSFEFNFNVNDGQIRLDVPFALMQPEKDQLPGSCKDWLPVGRFADVSNDTQGVTLATLDAPLVELGKLSTLLGSQSNPDVWRKHIEPNQTIYSWVMNNHWGTNYRAYQDGLVTFRYSLRPHATFTPADAAKFATALSQPLIVAPASGPAPDATPLLKIDPPDVLATTLKPADNGNAYILRLFGASGHDRHVKLSFPRTPNVKLSLTNTTEHPLTPAPEDIVVPGSELVSLRAELH